MKKELEGHYGLYQDVLVSTPMSETHDSGEYASYS